MQYVGLLVPGRLLGLWRLHTDGINDFRLCLKEEKEGLIGAMRGHSNKCF